MIRAVLDTNVLVSALILRGPTNQLVPLWQEEKFTLVLSKEIISECLRVFAYPKFKLSSEAIRTLVEMEILPFSEPVQIRHIPEVIHKDPSDNIFLACAVEGKCQYLVSGDHHLLDLKSHRGIPIISTAAFLLKLA